MEIIETVDIEPHTCPYKEEIHDDYESLCTCDEDQQRECALDV